MKKISVAICAFVFSVNLSQAQSSEKNTTAETISKQEMQIKSLYDYKAEDINGKLFDFASLKGKKVMIVNTASECGLTHQYKSLEELYAKYKDSGFTIVGFPSNDFAKQEPGSNQEISSFCQKNYGVTFVMMSKTSVKGPLMNEVYKFLTQKSLNGLKDSNVKWNFQKYLIDENGKLVKVVSPLTSPMSNKITNWIKG